MERSEAEITRVKARCPRCGVVVVGPGDVALTYVDDDTGGTCRVRCACRTEMLLPIDAGSARRLLEAGVGTVLPPLPTPISRREVRAFRRRLKQTDLLAAVAWRTIGTPPT